MAPTMPTQTREQDQTQTQIQYQDQTQIQNQDQNPTHADFAMILPRSCFSSSSSPSPPAQTIPPTLYPSPPMSTHNRPHPYPLSTSQSALANPQFPADKNAASVAAQLAADCHDRGVEVTHRFICMEPGCSKTFPRRYNLKVHLRKHTGERPYMCKHPGCGKQFRWRSSIAHHYKSHQRRNCSTNVHKKRGKKINAMFANPLQSSTSDMMPTVPPHQCYQTPQAPSEQIICRHELTDRNHKHNIYPYHKSPGSPNRNPHVASKVSPLNGLKLISPITNFNENVNANTNANANAHALHHHEVQVQQQQQQQWSQIVPDYNAFEPQIMNQSDDTTTPITTTAAAAASSSSLAGIMNSNCPSATSMSNQNQNPTSNPSTKMYAPPTHIPDDHHAFNEYVQNGRTGISTKNVQAIPMHMNRHGTHLEIEDVNSPEMMTYEDLSPRSSYSQEDSIPSPSLLPLLPPPHMSKAEPEVLGHHSTRPPTENHPPLKSHTILLPPPIPISFEWNCEQNAHDHVHIAPNEDYAFATQEFWQHVPANTTSLP